MKKWKVTKTLSVEVEAETEVEAIQIGNDVLVCEEYLLEGELEEHGIKTSIRAKEIPNAD